MTALGVLSLCAARGVKLVLENGADARLKYV
jgi:hypothetical protein